MASELSLTYLKVYLLVSVNIRYRSWLSYRSSDVGTSRQVNAWPISLLIPFHPKSFFSMYTRSNQNVLDNRSSGSYKS
jgi:hypothetical protein